MVLADFFTNHLPPQPRHMHVDVHYSTPVPWDEVSLVEAVSLPSLPSRSRSLSLVWMSSRIAGSFSAIHLIYLFIIFFYFNLLNRSSNGRL